MPTKQKNNVSEWSQCIRCDVIVYAKEMSKHRQECESSKPLSHGHVIGNVLIGVVSLQESKAAIPAKQKDHVIFLNTSTMQLCGLCIGGQCIVGKSQTMMVWPCANVNHTSVGLSENTMGKLTCAKGSLLTVEPFIESNQEAEEVSLSIQNGDSERLCADQSLTNYLKKSAMGKYLKIGNVLDIGYFGQTFSFIVERIEPKSLNKKLFNIKSDLNNSGLESSFTSLHISDKICPGDSQELFESSKTSGTHGQKQSYTSTPIKGVSKPGEQNKSELDTSLDKCHFDSSSASERLFDTKVKGEDTSKPDVFQTPVRNIRSTSSPCPSITTDSPVSQTSCTPVSQSSSTPDRSSGTPVSRNSGTPVSRTSDLSVSRNSYFCTPEASRTTRESSSGLFYKVTASTKLCVKSLESIDDKQADISRGVRFTDLGGLTTQIEVLKDFIHLPLRSPDIFKTYGLVQPRGVLIFGPSGCGKSTLVQAVKTELNIHCVTISGPEIWSKFYGETEQKLKSLFNEAKQRSPSLIVIDDIESLCPRRENTNSELEKRVVASFLTLMDGISDKATDKFVMVLGTTSKPDSVDPALRRPGRFDKEIEIGVPSSKDRREILQKVLRHCQTDLGVVDIAEVADKAHGYVGADLVALVKEASLHAIKTRAGHDSSSLSINKTDLEYAMDVIQPSAMREVQIEVPKVLWTEIGGQAEIKLKLKQAVEWPLKHPEAFQRMGISPPKGILMYGPPGCSKTMIAKALATESGLNFLAVKGPELFSKWVGESERAVREVFRKARGAAPSIVFFDEIDALAIERGSSSGGSNVADRVLAQLLTEIDGVEKLKDVTIVAATNRPDMIDKALLRPGRIDRILYVPLPDEDTRREIFRIKMSKMPISEDVSSDWLAEMTDGYTGAEITSICHEAALFALQENINSDCVSRSHFDVALKTVTPRISGSLLTFYENYHRSSGLHTI